MSLPQVLAQSHPAGNPWDVVQWGAILIGLVVVGFGGILLMRRWLRAQENDAQADPGFSLSELRAMRDRGEITPEEYERTRAHVIAKVKAALDKPPKKEGDDLASAPPPDDPDDPDAPSDGPSPEDA